MNKSQNRRPTTPMQVIEFPGNNGRAESEQKIEERLLDLTQLVADLTESGYGVLLGEDTLHRAAFDELCVKESALRWILRVAKHSSGGVREKLWTDIEDAVSDLEKTAHLVMHPPAAWPRLTAEAKRFDTPGRPNRGWTH
jgi:hypothetical protein